MKYRTQVRRAAKVAFALGMAVCMVLFATAAASTRYDIRRAGAPFWLSAEVSRGTLSVAWFGQEPDGTRNGFGNPGWRVAANDKFGVRWWFHIQLSRAIRVVAVPLWAPLLLAGAFTIGARRVVWLARDPARCGRCRYDLAGLPEKSPCPECGLGRLLAMLRSLATQPARMLAP
jgi:hypothetical protein